MQLGSGSYRSMMDKLVGSFLFVYCTYTYCISSSLLPRRARQGKNRGGDDEFAFLVLWRENKARITRLLWVYHRFLYRQ